MAMQTVLDKIGSEEDKTFILECLKSYSAITSLSGGELNMLYKVRDDFKCRTGQTFIEVYRDELPYYGLLLDQKNRCPYLFTVHLDRVPNFWTQEGYTNTIMDVEERLIGQLDDIIGIAIMYYIHQHYPVNILFTTNEEFCESWVELRDAIKTYKTETCPLIPVSVDIDVCKKLEEFEKENPVTIRSRDRAGKMNPLVVNHFRRIAATYGISNAGDSLGYTMVESGMLAHETKGEFSGAHVGIPLIHYHTDKEMTTWATVWNAIKLLSAIVADNEDLQL
jgi:hypothetical protein